MAHLFCFGLLQINSQHAICKREDELFTVDFTIEKINPWFISGRNKSRFSGYFKMFKKQ